MLLVVDIGNTNIEFGVFIQDKLKYNFRLATDRNITSDEAGIFTIQFFSIYNICKTDINNVIISSVVPQINYSIIHAMRKYLKKTPLVVGETISVDIVNMYENKKEVGTDRLVNAYAAMKKYGNNLIVVDFGTATTFDVVGEGYEYQGGLIYPGIKISIEALFQKAAKLPRVEILSLDRVVGKNTISSMQSGIIHGYVGAVKNIVEKIKQESSNSTMQVIATGGLAGIIGRYYVFDKIDKPLMLEGLNMIYKNHEGNLLT